MDNAQSPIDQRKHRIKQISTGLCIFLFILSLAFPIYIMITTIKNPMNTIVKKNITSNAAKTIAISKPSLAQYSQLYSKYSDTLKCPCDQTSISYDRFLSIRLIFHQICSSSFVSEVWIESLRHNDSKLFIDDFRITSSYAFQALRTLCEMSLATSHFDLVEFFRSEYMSSYLMSPDLFQLKMNSRIDELTNTMTNKFKFSFGNIQNLIKANVLFSGLQTNYQLFIQNNTILSSPITYNGCSCTSSSRCIRQSVIYDYSSGNILYKIPGFYTGCYVIESLLESDLRCFYNQTCIDHLLSYLSLPMNITVLYHLSSDRYDENTIIETLLSNLMIESWETSISYNNYYQQCQPKICTYTIQTPETIEIIEIIEIVQTKPNLIHLIALIIGIIGGIISIIQLIIPRLVKLVINGT